MPTPGHPTNQQAGESMLSTVTMLAPMCARNHACPERLRRQRFAGPATLRARTVSWCGVRPAHAPSTAKSA